MKKLIVIAIVAIFAAIPFNKVQAQYTIPAYDVQVTANTTFEDSGFSQQDQNREERKLTVEVEDEHRGSGNAWAYIVIYQLNGDLAYGPFKVKEDAPFEMTLDDELWGVKVTSASEDCSMSVWEE